MFNIFSVGRHDIDSQLVGYPYIATTSNYIGSPEEVLGDYDSFYERKPWKRFDHRLTGHLLISLGHEAEVEKKEPLFVIKLGDGSPYATTRGHKPDFLFMDYYEWIERRKWRIVVTTGRNKAIVKNHGGDYV